MARHLYPFALDLQVHLAGGIVNSFAFGLILYEYLINSSQSPRQQGRSSPGPTTQRTGREAIEPNRLAYPLDR
ncbi:hypothetical protein MJO28_010326 [Puccinia striiformis f. sp. tritici]|uniref:Uncharacterized protein n=1 Tax=Puccinia striiformis f. sp. tritici TaxID=168172 RepID=A0ACC0E5J8_9BASI|nr:hypothetical protein MJO28_010326 [Puccinia striiformis f. sp. tritici]